MTLVTSDAFPGLSFNPQYFSEEDIARLVTRPSIPPRAAPASPLHLPLHAPGALTEGDVDEAITKVLDAVNKGTLAPDIFKDVNVAAIADEARPVLIDSLVRGKVETSNLEAALAIRKRVRLYRGNTRLTVVDNGTETDLLQVDDNAEAAKAVLPVLEIAVVVIDVILVLCALAGVALQIASEIKQICTEIIKSAINKFLELSRFIVDPIRDLLPVFEAQGTSPEVVGRYLSQVGTSIYHAGKFTYDHQEVLGAVKDVINSLVSGVWSTAAAIFRLAAYIVAMIASGGAAVAAAVLQLIAAVCTLVNDCIYLAKKLP